MVITITIIIIITSTQIIKITNNNNNSNSKLVVVDPPLSVRTGQPHVGACLRARTAGGPGA
jgi:hypothetical protein